jgi:tight junction protein 1
VATSNNNYSPYKEIYTSDSAKIRIMTYTAHYNDNGIYRKLSLDSNSNCSIIASANGIFDCNGGILESADTGVSLNVPEGAIAKGCSFDLYFKVCHCKSHITNGKGEPLTNPIVMCGPRGIKFLKPIELVIPHFITLDGQSWSYAFKTAEPNGSFSEDPYSWNVLRFHKKTLINSVTVLLDSF